MVDVASISLQVAEGITAPGLSSMYTNRHQIARHHLGSCYPLINLKAHLLGLCDGGGRRVNGPCACSIPHDRGLGDRLTPR